LSGSRERIIKRNLLMIIPVYVASMAFPGFWERPQPLPVQLMEVSPGPNTRAGTVKACRRSHLSFNRGGQVSELLIKEG
jgi:HlyD family secretion protein